MISEQSSSQKRRIASQEKAKKAIGGNTQFQTMLNEIEAELSSFHTRSANEHGYDPRSIFAKDDYYIMHNNVMSDIYDDVAQGINPEDSVRKHITKLNLPAEAEETILKRINIVGNLSPDFEGTYDAPERPLLSREEFDKRFRAQQKVVSPEADTSTKIASNLDEDLDIWGGPAQEKPTPQAAPSARVDPDDLWRDPDPTETLKENPVVERVRKAETKKSEPVIKVGKPVQSDSATATKVTQSGNATPKKTPTPAPSVQARVSSTSTAATTSKVQEQVIDDMVKKSPASTGAPVKNTSRLSTMANKASAAVTGGTKNAKNLKMLGIASLLGVGAAAFGRERRTQQDNIDRRLQMQREGIIE